MRFGRSQAFSPTRVIGPGRRRRDTETLHRPGQRGRPIVYIPLAPVVFAQADHESPRAALISAKSSSRPPTKFVVGLRCHHGDQVGTTHFSQSQGQSPGHWERNGRAAWRKAQNRPAMRHNLAGSERSAPSSGEGREFTRP